MTDKILSQFSNSKEARSFMSNLTIYEFENVLDSSRVDSIQLDPGFRTRIINGLQRNKLTLTRLAGMKNFRIEASYRNFGHKTVAALDEVLYQVFLVRQISQSPSDFSI